LPRPPPRARAGDAAPEAADDEWPPLPPGGLSLVDLEKKVIERALRLKGGNITHAAAYLRVPRHILVYRIEKHGIRRDAP
jgi:DNA-binding NtrC family response regulator